ncbi:uncharacterized protein LOC128227347 [Mya arenaria]|uniref:uncharacterized protein LOC128227347 n=1 Tax=Mya arenaria TaxID=6604 RepID=UPI0022E6F43A|nr:uncharacterized protein LOC128227347 [Mya arenaria]
MGQQGINDFQLVGVTAPEGVREPSPGSVPFSELLNRVEKEANRLLSCIISLRKAKPYGPSTVKLFREECIYSKRELHLIRYVPALIKVPRVENHANPAMLEQAKNRPSPEQQHEQKENNVKKKDNPVQTNIIVELRTRLANALEHNGYLEESNKRLLAENEDLSIRLSRLAGERLTDGNPNITDLSDRNRPTKLGEVYSELYDNEWTNAFDGLIESGYDELEAIQTLKLTLLNIHEFCETKADSILTQTEEAVNCLFKKYKMLTEKKKSRQHLTVSRNQSREIRRSLRKLMQEYLLQSKWKPKTPAAAECKKEPTNDVKIQPIHVTDRMKKLLKEMSESMVPVVQMAFIEASWDSGCVEDLKPFIMKCIYVCWMMVVQNPLMCFFLPKPGTDVNTSMFKVYTKSGRTVDFIVWPAMMLHETGSVVCKGVLQPK